MKKSSLVLSFLQIDLQPLHNMDPDYQAKVLKPSAPGS